MGKFRVDFGRGTHTGKLRESICTLQASGLWVKLTALLQWLQRVSTQVSSPAAPLHRETYHHSGALNNVEATRTATHKPLGKELGLREFDSHQ